MRTWQPWEMWRCAKRDIFHPCTQYLLLYLTGTLQPWAIYWCFSGSCESQQKQHLRLEAWNGAHTKKRSLVNDGESPCPTPTSPRLIFLLPPAFMNTLLKYLQWLTWQAKLPGLVLQWKTFIIAEAGRQMADTAVFILFHIDYINLKIFMMNGLPNQAFYSFLRHYPT